MDPKLIKANLFLNVILPNIELLMEIDPSVAKLTKGWNNVIQFEAQNGGPAGYMEFTDGRLKAHYGRHDNPTVLFLFDSLDKFCAMIDGTYNPMPKKGIHHLILLIKFMKITTVLKKTLQPAEAALSDPAALKRTVTLLLNTAVTGMKVIAENDPAAEPTVKHLIDGSAQFFVMPDGPNAYVESKDRTLYPSRGVIKDPTVEMEIKDLNLAYRLLSGNLDTMAAIGAGDIVLRGFLPLFGDLSYIMNRISLYLS